MKVHLSALGCRLNQGEIDSMAREFSRRGDQVVEQAEDAELADLYVINTCAVTQEAVRSSRQLAYRLHRTNPDAQLVLTGCYAHLAPKEAALLPGVIQIVDNFTKESLVSIVTGEAAKPEIWDCEPLTRRPLVGAQGRTRAFIKVQDGCDRLCSFCVTRVARGKGRSRDLGEILHEIQDVSMVKEVVLTGVHLASYGHDLGQTDGLYRLIATILSDTDVPRVRLSSLEPWGITTGFFDLWQDRRLCRHLHLPLQSGCDATLRRMIRRTSQGEFRAVVESARAAIPDVAITTDVIVGFPGETDEEFAISKAFVEEMDFADMHLFRYSKRPGTAAIRLPNQVPEDVKRERSEVLHAVNEAHREQFAGRFLGATMPVLWEAVSGATTEGFVNSGYTDNYLRVRAVVPQVLTNQITPARLVEYDARRVQMRGELV